MHVGMHANTLEQCYIFECVCAHAIISLVFATHLHMRLVSL